MKNLRFMIYDLRLISKKRNCARNFFNRQLAIGNRKLARLFFQANGLNYRSRGQRPRKIVAQISFALKGQTKNGAKFFGLPFQGTSENQIQTEGVALGYNGIRLSGETLQFSE